MGAERIPLLQPAGVPCVRLGPLAIAMTTTVYEARKILTMNPSHATATHVAVRDGRIQRGHLLLLEAFGGVEGLQGLGRYIGCQPGVHFIAEGVLLIGIR